MPESFWKSPNVVDLASLVLAVGSIWFAWWLAKRDNKRQIDAATAATRNLIERHALTRLQADIEVVVRQLQDARNAARRGDWARFIVRVDDADAGLSRVRRDRRLTVLEAERIEVMANDIETLEVAGQNLHRGPVGKSLPPRKQKVLNALIRDLAAAATRIRGQVLETPDA